jgi:hypothetical protein
VDLARHSARMRAGASPTSSSMGRSMATGRAQKMHRPEGIISPSENARGRLDSGGEAEETKS